MCGMTGSMPRWGTVGTMPGPKVSVARSNVSWSIICGLYRTQEGATQDLFEDIESPVAEENCNEVLQPKSGDVCDTHCNFNYDL